MPGDKQYLSLSFQVTNISFTYQWQLTNSTCTFPCHATNSKCTYRPRWQTGFSRNYVWDVGNINTVILPVASLGPLYAWIVCGSVAVRPLQGEPLLIRCFLWNMTALCNIYRNSVRYLWYLQEKCAILVIFTVIVCGTCHIYRNSMRYLWYLQG